MEKSDHLSVTRQLDSMGTSGGNALPSPTWKKMPTTKKSTSSVHGNKDLGSGVYPCDPMSCAQLLPSPRIIVSINEGSNGKKINKIDEMNS